MSNVFEVIDALRLWKGCSLRELANEAGITYTTLASIMSRRSSKIAIRILEKLARVFDVEWFELLGSENADEPEKFISGRYSDEPRVQTELSEKDARQVLHAVIGDNYEEYFSQATVKPIERKTSESEHFVSQRSHFKHSINFVLDRLNDDGLMEAMRKVLDLVNEPKFCISTDFKNKEDTKWLEKEQ